MNKVKPQSVIRNPSMKALQEESTMRRNKLTLEHIMHMRGQN